MNIQPTTYADAEAAYVDAVLQIHLSGQMDVAEAYQGAGYRCPNEDESELDYIACIAEQDFEDGFLDAACFQKIYDRVTKRSRK